MRRWKLIIAILAAASIAAHMLLYIYQVPDVPCAYCHETPCNPNVSFMRIAIYAACFFMAQLLLLEGQYKVLMATVCSIMGCLIWNESTKTNQDWGGWQFAGFALALLFPFLEVKLMQYIERE